MLEWLQQNSQIDLGNALVGIGTVTVALVTLYVAMSGNKMSRNRVRLEFRGLWIEEIRKVISSYVGAVEAFTNAATDSEQQAHSVRIRELDVYLRLKFDLSDTDAPELFAHLDNVLHDIRNKKQPSEEDLDRIMLIIRRLLEDRWTSLASC